MSESAGGPIVSWHLRSRGLNESTLCSASFSSCLSPSMQLSEHQTTGTAISQRPPSAGPRTHASLKDGESAEAAIRLDGRLSAKSMPLFFCQDFKLYLEIRTSCTTARRLFAEDYASIQSKSWGTVKFCKFDARLEKKKKGAAVPALAWIFPDYHKICFV